MNSSDKPREDSGVKPLCYFLVCYSSKEFVAFLLASLFRDQDIFFIHCDKKAPSKLKMYLEKVSRTHPNIILMHSQDYSWAGYSHVDISLKAIAAAMAYPQAWSHFVFLSEQHLPLKSPREIAAYLRSRKSLVALRRASDMVGDERADIRNRFQAGYRELSGVGCFATRLVQRDEEFFTTIFHGSNWIVLHREHCSHLLEAEAAGRFKPFHTVVHAEETAMQSILAPLREEIENFDPTIVAWPHLTDNPYLVMSESFFQSAIKTSSLFIRKRTDTLSPFVREFVTCNHFCSGLYASAKTTAMEVVLGFRAGTVSVVRERLAQFSIARLEAAFRRESAEPLAIQRIKARENLSTPQLHLILQTPSMGKGLSVRVLSENMIDFKICIAREPEGHGSFQAPYVAEGRLHSTIRAKIYLLQGYEDILPLEIEDAGFVSFATRQGRMRLRIAVAQFLQAAAAISHAEPSDIAVHMDHK